MEITIYRFKPSGKWYDTFTIEIILHPSTDYRQAVIDALVKDKKIIKDVKPLMRTIDDWFIMTIVKSLPIIIWVE